MSQRPRVNPESIRTVNPSTWPQYPYNKLPRTPEQSEVRYSIFSKADIAICVFKQTSQIEAVILFSKKARRAIIAALNDVVWHSGNLDTCSTRHAAS
jgi:hypothetical protein